MLPKSIEWVSENRELVLLDQRKLPNCTEFFHCKTVGDVEFAIKNMVVRGAPAIGVAASFGTVIAAQRGRDFLLKSIEILSKTRPTAFHLFWALNRIKRKIDIVSDENLYTETEKFALYLYEEDLEINRNLSEFGASLLPEVSSVITHCNAGALATCGYGTALGIFRIARENGKRIKIYSDETRPILQGSKLTVWELLEDGFDVTQICDNMAAFLMFREKIDAVIVGADRIANNGDTANKIGTYSLAVIAKEHSVPFYVAAPLSTIDINCESGKDIPIEERSADEVRYIEGNSISPKNAKVWNPAFDVTPSKYITGIITEKGIFTYPFDFKENIGVF